MKQVSEGEVGVVLRGLSEVIAGGVDGDVVEMGCYKGETSVLLGAELVGTGKDLWLYDSFEGLPSGGEFAQGELRADESEVLRRFKKAGLVEPFVVKGWFSELSVEDMPGKICFAFLDGDFYESMADSLRLVAPRMVSGGVIVVHDFRNSKLPGVKKAVMEFARGFDGTLKEEGGLGILQLKG
ncbi:TylF/MycF family methyltransferase [Candidatus Saccharibacteria bacterium]|nr:TylF/MycF family methyltransferase [Candidatus Saccharibacteria bacterium]